MARQEYDNNGNPLPKKPIKFKFAGFTFGLGHIVALLLVVGCVALFSFISSESKRKADEAAVAARMEELERLKAQQGQEAVDVDLHAQIQASLVKQYGLPPEGFEWDYTGGLVPIGNDDDHNCEDVVYMFLRAVSMLDFSTAARYSTDSSVIASYQNYYGIVAEAVTDYYNNFLRKQYKTSLTSLEVDGISDIAVFADGSEYLTVTIKCMDLSDKDFWEPDRDTLFQKMRVYRETETDTTKMEQYVYDYMLEKYEEGVIDKKAHTIELVVSKDNGGGWLVSGDKELDAYLQYESGVDVAQYILDEFSEWYTATVIREQLEAINGLTTNENNGEVNNGASLNEDPTDTPPASVNDDGEEAWEGTPVDGLDEDEPTD